MIRLTKVQFGHRVQNLRDTELNTRCEGLCAHINSIPDEVLLDQILADPPDIHRHVHLSAVCHRWRAGLAKRRALTCQLQNNSCRLGRECAFLSVLSRCMALESLTVPSILLTSDMFDVFSYLPFTKTLSSLIVSSDSYCTLCPLGRVLASLPALKMLDVRVCEKSLTLFQCKDDIMLRHCVRELAIACNSPSTPVMFAAFFDLQRLRMQLPLISDDIFAHFLAGLHAAMPRLEALELCWDCHFPKGIVHGVNWETLRGLLSEARALRELILPLTLFVKDDAFVRFIGEHLKGLEILQISLRNESPRHVLLNLEFLERLPRLREADIEVWGEFQSAVSTLSCASSTLERLKLTWDLSSDLKFAMPALKLLYLTLPHQPNCVVNCPALEELSFDRGPMVSWRL